MTEKEMRDLVLRIAWKHYGRFYTWGGDDPSGFDCSGLVVECLKSVGILKRRGDWTAAGLAKEFGERLLPANLPPRGGDLVFWHNEAGRVIHVEICLNYMLAIGASGGGSFIKSRADAIAHNAFIKVRPIQSRRGVWGIVNPY